MNPVIYPCMGSEQNYNRVYLGSLYKMCVDPLQDQYRPCTDPQQILYVTTPIWKPLNMP